MQHMIVKAATTATTDRGEFTAIAAAYTVDRVKDRIVPGAFGKTIDRWKVSGKRIPLHWNHEGDAKSIIGSVDPSTMRETGDGLYVEGKLDLTESDTAREAWRSMKNGAMSLSFGYMVEKARKAGGGVTELQEIDLFEVSIVPVPANADTRVLSLKAATHTELLTKELQEVKERLDNLERALRPQEKKAEEADKEPETVRSVDPLRKRAEEAALAVASDGFSLRKPPNTPAAPEAELVPLDELRRKSRELMLTVLSDTE